MSPASGRRRSLGDEEIDLDSDAATVLLRAVFESSPDGIAVVGTDGVIRAANRAFASTFGTTVDASIGSPIESFVPDERRASHRRHRERFDRWPTRRPMGSELRLLAQHDDGDTFPVEVSLSPVTVDAETLTIATVRDVSERQAARSGLARAEERERIGRDLNDMVIQRLFAAGMSLQAVMSMVESPAARERVVGVTDDLDDTIHELRNAIFRLGPLEFDRSLTAQIHSIVDERSRFLGVLPNLDLDGGLDDVPEYVAEQLLATLTEALSNVARHAEATEVRIDVVRRDGDVRLTVVDDGNGIGATPKPRGGLSDMMWRAAELGGSCAIAPNEPRGTRLVWRVPT